MKYLIILVIVLWGCISSNTTGDYIGTRIVYIDGCEYVITDTGGICHKGNCPNPMHRGGQ